MTVPDDSVTQLVHCVRCGRPVMLAYTPGVVVDRHDWVCPYEGCWMLQTIELSGHDVSARPDTAIQSTTQTRRPRSRLPPP